VFIEAFGDVVTHLPRAKAVLVGDGPERVALARLANRLGNFAERIHFAGWRDDVPSILAAAEADVRSVAGIPASYKVLFLQGGASTQFSMVPMNLLTAGATADYIDSGSWGDKAIKEAKKVGTVNKLVTEKAGPEDVAAYRNWLISITDVVISAARSGDVLGFGGQLVTASEHNFRDRLVLALQQ